MRDYLYRLATDEKNGFFARGLKAALLFLSFFYGAAVWVLRSLYRVRIVRGFCFSGVVISIGNITVGGTGKTPLVAVVARHLQKKGRRVAVLIRGYARDAGARDCSYRSVGDEAAMLMEELQGVRVLVGRDRVRNARIAQERYGADTLILDDGFQHWRMRRSLDIVLVDAKRAFGNRRLLPRGLLREPLSALGRAGIIVLSKVDTVASESDIRQFCSDFFPAATVASIVHKPVGLTPIRHPVHGGELKLESLKGRLVCALSGIGDPEYFEHSLRSLGARVVISRRFPDHYAYTAKDLKELYHACQQNKIDTIITTHKDAVRIRVVHHEMMSLGIAILVLKTEVQFADNEQGFFRRVDALFAR